MKKTINITDIEEKIDSSHKELTQIDDALRLHNTKMQAINQQINVLNEKKVRLLYYIQAWQLLIPTDEKLDVLYFDRVSPKQ